MTHLTDLLGNADLNGFYHYTHASVFVVQLTTLQDFHHSESYKTKLP
jgi:hypothetical protein